MSATPASAASRPSRPSFLRSISASSTPSSSSSTTKDKPRLYVALCLRHASTTSVFFRDEINCDAYHWALLVAPKTPPSSRADAGTRYHVEHVTGCGQQRWRYAEDDLQDIPTAQNVIIRVAVAKVVDTARLQTVLREAPVVEEDASWNCLSWVRAGFARLVGDNGRAVKGYVEEKDWREIENRARDYAKQKRQERRWLVTGEQLDGGGAQETVPTWNFWENRETAA